MSRAADRLRAAGFINAWGVAKAAREQGVEPQGVYIDYRPAAPGRAYRVAAWQVVRPGFKTDPGGHWQDDEHKTFAIYYGGWSKAAQRGAALAWATERYGITDWATIPGLPGTLFPKVTADWVKARVRAAAKGQAS